jgi:hypothetical protein
MSEWPSLHLWGRLSLQHVRNFSVCSNWDVVGRYRALADACVGILTDSSSHILNHVCFLYL